MRYDNFNHRLLASLDFSIATDKIQILCYGDRLVLSKDSRLPMLAYLCLLISIYLYLIIKYLSMPYLDTPENTMEFIIKIVQMPTFISRLSYSALCRATLQ